MFGKMGVDREVWHNETLDAGDYLCHRNKLKIEEVYSFNFSADASSEAQFIRDEKWEYPDFLQQVFICIMPSNMVKQLSLKVKELKNE